MKKHWIILLAVTLVSAGCGRQESAERAARDALQDEKVKAALANQERGSVSMPAELDTSETTKPDDSKKVDDTAPVASSDSETAPTIQARSVLDDAIALAKTENKALFVHFTADW